MLQDLYAQLKANISLPIAVALVAAGFFFLGISYMLTSPLGWLVLGVAAFFGYRWWTQYKKA